MAQLPSESLFGDYSQWPGRDVLDSGGERLGGVREIYLDRETGHPEWVLVDVENDTARFVPLADASVGTATIQVAHTASEIRNAPGIGAEAQIDQAEERRLYAHYGLGYSEDDSGSGLPSEDAPVPQVTESHEETISSAAPPTTDGGTSETHTETFQSAEPPPWRREAEPETPPPAWGTPEPPAAADSATPPDETTPPTSGWSAAAEPSIEAPPPAEPPTPEEIEAAEIPEPPAVSERLDDLDVPAIATPPGDDLTTPPVLDPPSVSLGPDTSAFEPPAEPAPTEASAFEAPPSEPVPFVAPPSEPSTPPPASASVPPRPTRPEWSSPPPEPPAGALATIKERPVAIAAAAAIATALFLIIRRLR